MRQLPLHIGCFLLLVVAFSSLSGCDLEENTPSGDVPFTYSVAYITGLGRTIDVIGDISPKQIQSVALTGNAPTGLTFYDDRAWVINSLSNTIQSYILPTWQAEKTIPVGTATNPISLTFTESQQNTILWVSCFISNEVLAIDAHSGNILERIALPASSELPVDPGGPPTQARPDGIVAAADRVWVVLTNLTVSGFSPGGPGLLVEVDPILRIIVELHVLKGRNPGNPTLSLDGQSLLIPHRGDFDLQQGGYVGNGTIEEFDLTTRLSTRDVEVGGAPTSIEVTTGGIGYATNAKESTIFLFDANTFMPLQPIPVPPPPVGDLSFLSSILLDSAGQLWATEFNSDRLYIFNGEDGRLLEGPISLGDGPGSLALVQ